MGIHFFTYYHFPCTACLPLWQEKGFPCHPWTHCRYCSCWAAKLLSPCAPVLLSQHASDQAFGWSSAIFNAALFTACCFWNSPWTSNVSEGLLSSFSLCTSWLVPDMLHSRFASTKTSSWPFFFSHTIFTLLWEAAVCCLLISVVPRSLICFLIF